MNNLLVSARLGPALNGFASAMPAADQSLNHGLGAAGPTVVEFSEPANPPSKPSVGGVPGTAPPPAGPCIT